MNASGSLPFVTPVRGEFVRGAVEIECTERGLLPHRLPRWAGTRGADPMMVMAATQPSGVRLVVRTAATVVELETHGTKRIYTDSAPRPDGVYELTVDGEVVDRGAVPAGDLLRLDMMTGETVYEAGPSGRVRFADLPAGPKDVEIWLPHDETTVLVALHTDEPVLEPSASARPRWVHHGSSISHGSNATRPTGTWPAVAARLAGVDLTNLGLGASALLDPLVARVVRDLPADLITLKIGINLVNQDLIRRRALAPAVHGYLDTIRDGHPTTPLWLVTPILCPLHEQTPGPALPDEEAFARGKMKFVAVGSPDEVAQGKLTLEVIRDVMAEVVDERNDDHLHLLNGLGLYGLDDHDAHPLPDGLHPGPETHQLMGERFARQVFGV